ncbi:MAG: bifunctional 5,10-methylenetetrahydrofolate dehydrogenase/5,10-methenyltetrahydrofolate cyclohydrolase [Candidatus Shapirobacteria bacterium]|jgi:methylenetetrahydrofolate dehydrogenase (NADP+)/methenyltetrahydrofolate cyclohydrolase
MQLLDGKALAEKKLADLKLKIEDCGLKINLDIILVGTDSASIKYVELKQKKAAEIGIGGQLYRLPENISLEELQKLIAALNQNPQSSAFFVQLPIPNLSDTSTLLNNISPQKDADGLTAVNLGLLFQQNKSAVPPATAIGILNLLDEYQINLESKKAVIINDSPIVGLPLLALFNSRHATVAICHRYTKDLLTITRDADIIVSATGVKNLVTADMVKDGVVAIDVGGGDIDFAAVSKKSSYITPTFGGVGPMTVASLLENTYLLATRK